MDEIIKVKVEEVVIVAPDKVEMATPTISTDGKNIIATQKQPGGYVPTGEKSSVVPATALDPDLRPEHIVKGVSIFGVEGTKSFNTQNKSIKITKNGTEEVKADAGYGMEKVVVETDVHPELQEKTIAENGEHTADTGYDGLSKVKVNVQPKLQKKTTTGNGTVTPDDGFYGLEEVEVDVQPSLQKKALTIDANGSQTIKADEEHYGLEEVEVVVDVQPELQEKEIEIKENGSQTITPEGADGLSAVKVTVDVKPKLQSKSTAANGTVTPDDGFDGLEKVVVNVQPRLHSKTITANGSHGPDANYQGLSSVYVNVKPTLQDKTITITENGTTEIKADAGNDGLGTVNVEVDVQSEDLLRTFLKKEITGTLSYDDVQYLGAYAIASQNVEHVSFPALLSIGERCFWSCSKLKTADIGQTIEIPAYAFNGCTSLETLLPDNTVGTVRDYAFTTTTNFVVDFVLTGEVALGQSAFRKSGIKSFTAHKLGTANTYCLSECPNLTRVDIGRDSTSNTPKINANSFTDSAITALIIRNTKKVYSLAATSALSGTPIANGTGYIYVPDALVDSYKAATNWSTYADQIKPLSELPE